MQLFQRWTSSNVQTSRVLSFLFSRGSWEWGQRKSKQSSGIYLIGFMSVFFSLPTLTGAFCRLFSCLVSWQGNFYLNTTLIMVNRFKKTFIRIEELIYLSSVLHITLYKCLIACKGYCRLPFSHSLSALLLSLFKIISISLGHR